MIKIFNYRLLIFFVLSTLFTTKTQARKTVVITFLNGNNKQELNGKLVNEGTQTEISEGRILLQYEGYPIDFRKVVVRELK